jgi:hypothetical protein
LEEIRILPSLSPLPRGSSPGGDLPLAFVRGERIEATVLNQIDPRRVLLRIQNREIVAETDLSLPRQETLAFIVEETRPNILLRPVPPEDSGENSVAVLLKRRMAASLSSGAGEEVLPLPAKAQAGGNVVWLQPQLQPLARFLQASALSPPFAGIREDPARILQGSGLFLENKIGRLIREGREEQLDEVLKQDLKGLLLTAGAALNPASEDCPKDLLPGVERALEKIELFQLLNLRQADPARNFFFQIPLWFGGNLRFVEMNLSLPDKEDSAGDEEGYSVLFLLSLPALGRMRVEARLREKDLFCRIIVCRGDAAQAVSEALPGLIDRLAGLGFRPRIRVAQEREDEMKSSWVRDLAGKPDSSFTIRV